MVSLGLKRERGRRERGRRRTNAWVELGIILVVAVGLALGIQRFLVKPYKIPSQSMVPTLAPGQRVLVNRLSYRWSNPHRGDIVVFNPPHGADFRPAVCGVPRRRGEACRQGTPTRSATAFIKRVVAVPGDHVQIRGNRVYVNGQLQREPYARTTPCELQSCTLTTTITIPPGDFFMMGDNRGYSDDSRDWGPAPKKWLIGRAFFTYWPPDRIGGF